MKLYYCVYDNPATMHRECYCNKELQWAYSFKYMYLKRNYIAEYPWITNQLIDSIKALPDKYIRLHMEY